jgi:hypothetical protein
MKEIELRRSNLASKSNDVEECGEEEPRRKIIVYIEYQSVRPSVRIGSPKIPRNRLYSVFHGILFVGNCQPPSRTLSSQTLVNC